MINNFKKINGKEIESIVNKTWKIIMGNKAKTRRKKKQFTLGTFNVRGLTKGYKQESLSRDIDKYEIDICCIQETKITEDSDITMENGNRLITIRSDTKEYGNGFIISKKWKESVNGYWRISDRICVLQVKTDKSKCKNKKNEEENIYQAVLTGTKMKITKRNIVDHVITIINIYAPTTERVKHNPKELETMYIQLTDLVNNFKNLSTAVVFIGGDFNAKIGKSDGTETCIGKFSRGRRNNSGKSLIDFCESNEKFICNSCI